MYLYNAATNLIDYLSYGVQANDYSVGLASFFTKSFTKLGGQIVANLKYQAGDQDFTAQLTEIASKKPEILFIPSYFAEGAIIMKQVKELGAKFQVMGGDAMDNPQIVEIGGAAVEGFVHTTFPYDPSMKNMSPMAKKFTENWKKAFPSKEPNVNAALGYDTYLLVLDAIKRAGKAEPAAITKALAATKGFEGVTGSTTINAGTLQIGAGGTTGSLGTGTVSNSGTLAFSRSDDITVANVIPVITAPADQTADEGTSKTFDLGSFTDPGADSPWQVTIDWGDSSADSVFTEAAPGSITDTAHTYAELARRDAGDFAEEADKSISATNYKAELDTLADRIRRDPPAPTRPVRVLAGFDRADEVEPAPVEVQPGLLVARYVVELGRSAVVDPEALEEAMRRSSTWPATPTGSTRA